VGRSLGQLPLPVGALGLKVTKRFGERRSAAVVESSQSRAIHRKPDAGTRLATEASDGSADVVEGEHCPIGRRVARGGAGAAAGCLLGTVAEVEQVGLAVQPTTVPVRVVVGLVGHPRIPAAGEIARFVASRRERRAVDRPLKKLRRNLGADCRAHIARRAHALHCHCAQGSRQ
jgi:hypothetical protein